MSGPPGDADAVKERERATWSAVSVGWKTHDAKMIEFSRPVTEELIRHAKIRPGLRVLDLASGTGEPSLSIAERVGPGGSVLGVDLAEPMLAVARDKAAQRGLTNVEYRVADAENLDLPSETFDAATMRWGIMFLPDPVAAMREVRRVLRPDAKLALSAWGPPDANPFLRIPLDVMRRHIDVPTPAPGSPGLFAFAQAARLPATLQQAGFGDVGAAELKLRVKGFETGSDYWTFQRAIAGPIARLYEPLSPELRRTIDEEVAAEAEKYRVGSQLEVPAMTWIGWGTR